MSEPYILEGITITPQGGGFYELTHPSLPEPIKERGKENAEARAVEIARTLSSDEGAAPLEAQADLPPMPVLSQEVPSQPVEAPIPGPDTQDPVSAAQTAEITELRAENAEINAKLDALMALVTKTVVSTGGEVPDTANRVPGTVAREYTGVFAEDVKAKYAAMGVETRDIILEENESIPPTGLFVGHNGKAYMIKPGEPVTVPKFLTDILDDAVTSVAITDSTSQKIIGHRNRSKYPYRVI